MQNFGVTNKERYRMLWYFWSGQLSSKHLNCGENFGVTNKERYRMLWYFWSGQLSSKHLNCGVHHVSLNIKKPLAFKNVTDLKM